MSARLCAAAWNIVGDCDETYNYWEPVGTYLKLRPSLSLGLLVRTLCSLFRIIMSATLCAAAWNIVGDCDETYNYWEPVGTYLKLRPSLSLGLLVRTLCSLFRIIMSATLCAAAWNIVGDCDETYNYWETVGTHLKLRPSLNPELPVRTLCLRSSCQQDCVPRPR